MDENVHVDEFVLGGAEKRKIGRSYKGKKKKAVTAVQLTDDRKLRRMYAMRIEYFSVKSLQCIFVNNISREAQEVTDKWKGYRPITKAYSIQQIECNKGLNFKALHTYTCPAGEALNTNGRWYNKKLLNGRKSYQVKHYKTKACQGCQLRNQCTTNKKGRLIERTEYQEYITRNNQGVNLSST